MNRPRLSALCLTLLLGACGTAGPVFPPAQERASAQQRRALELFASGQLEQAERAFAQALEADRAIENEEGIATNLLNLAQTRQRLGKTQEAILAARAVVDESPIVFAPRYRNDAALRLAVMALGQDKYAEAAEWLASADRICPPESCPSAGRRANIRAQLALAENRLDEALLQAETALKEAQGRDDDETSNALRNAANALIFAQRPSEALPRLQQALTLDKRLAASRKIYRDLLLLGLASEKLGDVSAARSYYQRAANVAEAAKDPSGLQEARRMQDCISGKACSR